MTTRPPIEAMKARVETVHAIPEKYSRQQYKDDVAALLAYVEELEKERKQARKDKLALKNLSDSTGAFLRALDILMKEPEGNVRGRKIAKLSNDLEMANDTVRYFHLGVDYRKDTKAAQERSARKALSGEGG